MPAKDPEHFKYLTRDQFREGVFKRDRNLCVLCSAPAVDAHHIMERRLWSGTPFEGGYFLENGASVCQPCHLQCESTSIDVELLYELIGVKHWPIPPHLYTDQQYDKWGNIILPNGTRLKGDLFHDESVQKILAYSPHLNSFVDHVKYPRTFHLPWSDNHNKDDKVLESTKHFEGKRVIVTEKMDGENTTMYSNYIHARSLDFKGHVSRDWVKTFWSKIAHDIPEGWRICGENLYAVHSIKYTKLPSFFVGYSMWDHNNRCLDWDSTRVWFDLIGVVPVPVLYDGIFHEAIIRKLYDQKRDWDTKEGYVLRIADEFSYGNFRNCVAKYVRKDHIQTTKHWMYGSSTITRNDLE